MHVHTWPSLNTHAHMFTVHTLTALSVHTHVIHYIDPHGIRIATPEACVCALHKPTDSDTPLLLAAVRLRVVVHTCTPNLCARMQVAPGVANLVGGAVFPVGLIAIFLTGANLYTGKVAPCSHACRTRNGMQRLHSNLCARPHKHVRH
jgi:hypothetical protein